VANDSSAVIGDPRLPSQNGLSLPVYNGTNFGSGLNTIRAVFIDFVMRYGKLASNSAAIDRADNNDVPADDILGNTRNGTADIGAFEASAAAPPTEPPARSSHTVLSWLLLLLGD